jgi:hypothetical protein
LTFSVETAFARYIGQSAGNYTFGIRIKDVEGNQRVYSWEDLKNMGLPYMIEYIPAAYPIPTQISVEPSKNC